MNARYRPRAYQGTVARRSERYAWRPVLGTHIYQWRPTEKPAHAYGSGPAHTRSKQKKRWKITHDVLERVLDGELEARLVARCELLGFVLCGVGGVYGAYGVYDMFSVRRASGRRDGRRRMGLAGGP